LQSLWHYQEDEKGLELPDGKRKGVKVAVERPTVVGGSFEAEDGSIGTVIVNATPERQEAKLELRYSKCPVTLYNAERIKEQHWEECPEKVNVTLEPYDIKIFILLRK
jgi:hypothetical protein